MPARHSTTDHRAARTQTHQQKHRQGPRPLLLHLMTEALILGGCCAVSQLLKNGSPFWNDALPPEARQDPAGFGQLLEEEARRRYDDFLNGVVRYRGHHRIRRLAPMPVHWQSGTSCLHRFAEKGIPVLLVPSLVNRAVILDLTGSRSLARYMARHELQPFLMDWNAPGLEEEKFRLSDYVLRRLVPAAEAVRMASGQSPVILGYCMGGLLAIALALCRPDLCSGYIALATPWDFHAGPDGGKAALRSMTPHLIDLTRKLGVMPTDLIQALFSSLDPGMVGRKFRSFAQIPPRSARANAFVAVEDWLNDGVPLAGPTAEECLVDWYGHNKTAHRKWAIGTTYIDPKDLDVPSLVMIPTQDRIVPPDCARALATALPDAQTREVDLGHIGMITGSTAPNTVYRPLVQWIRSAVTTNKNRRQ